MVFFMNELVQIQKCFPFLDKLLIRHGKRIWQKWTTITGSVWPSAIMDPHLSLFFCVRQHGTWTLYPAHFQSLWVGTVRVEENCRWSTVHTYATFGRDITVAQSAYKHYGAQKVPAPERPVLDPSMLYQRGKLRYIEYIYIYMYHFVLGILCS